MQDACYVCHCLTYHYLSIIVTQEKEFITINGIMKRLEKISNKWITVANILKLPTSVISTINALTLHQPTMGDSGALYKVIEWWFVNTANPEWTAIDRMLYLLGIHKPSSGPL